MNAKALKLHKLFVKNWDWSWQEVRVLLSKDWLIIVLDD